MGGNKQEWGDERSLGFINQFKSHSYATNEEVPDDSGTRLGPLLLECYLANLANGNSELERSAPSGKPVSAR